MRLAVETAGKRRQKLDQSILARAFRGELVPQDPNDEPASVLLERIRAERESAGPKTKGRRGRKAKAVEVQPPPEPEPAAQDEEPEARAQLPSVDGADFMQFDADAQADAVHAVVRPNAKRAARGRFCLTMPLWHRAMSTIDGMSQHVLSPQVLQGKPTAVERSWQIARGLLRPCRACWTLKLASHGHRRVSANRSRPFTAVQGVMQMAARFADVAQGKLRCGSTRAPDPRLGGGYGPRSR